MKWSVPIVVIALSACILFGSIGFQETTRETTVYTPVLTDLAPLAQSGQVTEEVNYNPLANVTGWGATVGYETQTAASLYVYNTDYSYSSHTTNTVESYGKYILAPTVDFYFDWEWSDGSDVSNTLPEGPVIGGWNGTRSNPIYEGGSLVGTEYLSSSIGAWVVIPETEEYDQFPYVVDLSSVLPNDSIVTASDYSGENTYISFRETNPGNYTYSYESRTEAGLLNRYIRVNWSFGEYSNEPAGDYVLKNGLWYKIHSYSPVSGPAIDYSRTYTVSMLSNDLGGTIPYRTIDASTTYYIKPYTEVTVQEGQATWGNGYPNTKVQFLADAADMYFSVNGTVTPSSPLTSIYADMAVWAGSTYTGKILVTIDGTAGESYWQGVTSFADTKTYEISPYKYSLTAAAPGTVPAAGSTITSIVLYYLDGASGKAAVTDTWMMQDYNGLLWADATFPINTAFTSIWNTENIRISFNSFVITGTGLTINGTTYPVDSDGMVTIDDDTFKVAGSALEWEANGSTILIAPNGDEYDLGPRTGSFTLAGTWYGAMSMDTFDTRSSPATEALFGQHAEDSWRSWVFVGVLVLGTVAILATGRQLDVMDLLILVLAGAAGLVMAVML